MLLLKWLWIGNGKEGEIPPIAVFWTLRVLMFALSFVLEDWALHELITSRRQRRAAVLLVASSYVTWTYQTHTFSNSIETLAVAWSLVLIQRIIENKQRSSIFASAILAFVIVFGIFNRITFPAFLLIPCLQLIPHFIRKPQTLVSMALAGLLTTFVAVYLDTKFYSDQPVTWSYLFSHPVLTPLNNLTYNMSTSNLAIHGLHPRYQHVLANLPLLLGPAVIMPILRPNMSLRLYSAISGLAVLSIFQHQEARFLLPTIPLLLSSIDIPKNQKTIRIYAGIWFAFNILMGLVMGVYHQGGVIPAQVFLSKQLDATQAVWWKTYSPPIWLLNGRNEVLKTHDVMGMDGYRMVEELQELAPCQNTSSTPSSEATYLIAPLSATFLDNYLSNNGNLQFSEVWRYKQHLNLDDLDFGDDGIWPTLNRVIGRRGLGAWKVTTTCPSNPKDPVGSEPI